jgi:predicted CXXCH cytochrome family protein
MCRWLSRNYRPAVLSLCAAGVLLTLAPRPVAAQDNDFCFECHSDPDLTAERNGAEISAFVDQAAFEASLHGDMECIMCHADLEGEDFHEEEVAPVDCGMCHDSEAEAHAKSLHGRAAARSNGRGPTCAGCHGAHAIQPLADQDVDCASCHQRQGREHQASLHGQAAQRGDPLAPSCKDCHGGHSILSARDHNSPTAVMNVPVLCGRCHQEGTEVSQTHEIHQDHILEHYSMSIHGEGLYRQGLTVTAVCTSCHTSHFILPHTDPRSSIHEDNVARTCEQCHAQIEEVHRAVVEGRLWRESPDKVPACVDCHSPHKIRKVFYPATAATQDCLNCHGDPTIDTGREPDGRSLYVDREAFLASEHREKACAQCHTSVDVSLKERPCAAEMEPVDCSICHAEVVTEYEGSTHGTLHAQGDPDAPSCLSCHDNHATLPKENPLSPTFAQNVPLLCAKCHRAGEQAAVRIHSDVTDIVQSYVDSIHGKGLLESGLVVTATCADCHTAHGELPPTDERSTVYPANVQKTCSRCHLGIGEIFKTSIHWPENNDTDKQLPTCNTCHSSHTIIRSDLDDFRFEMMKHCGDCHQEESETFFDTFHGKVSRLGSAGAAKCYDCHGTHGILPSTDPDSTLGRNRVVDTCGQCHEGSHRQFAGYLTHATHHDPEKYPWLFWSFWFMTILLVGTLTFALLHTLAWLVRLYLSKDEWRAHKEQAQFDHKPTFRRFTLFNRILHLWMVVSFFTLALTGMALKFSYMKWAEFVAFLSGGFAGMGALHRVGAFILFAVFLGHLWYVRHRKVTQGLSWKDAIYGEDTILFTFRDLKEAVQSIRWFFGLGGRPRYGRYTYWEKFDYFAVLWGILIIGGTGLVLWFPETFTHILPGWSVNVATIIHSDEALLAVGFIFTIHFFNTHFRPDKFPLDQVMFHGAMTLEELEYDKPGEYERLKSAGELDDHIVDPPRPNTQRMAKAGGFLALTIGLTLIALILFTMLFGYR